MRTAHRTDRRTPHATRSARTSHRAAALRAGRRRSSARLQRAALPVVDRPAGTRLTRRGRLVAVLVLVALLTTAFSLGRAGSEASTGPAAAPATVQTTVQPGESLWAVATRIAPQSDPREVVHQLRQLNDLRGSGLQAGQQLLLPA